MLPREQEGRGCALEGLPRLSREQEGQFCARKGLPRLPREQEGRDCAREGLPRLSREQEGRGCARDHRHYFLTGAHWTPRSFRAETSSVVTATLYLVEWNSILYLVCGS